jgi:dipeptidyl aminopeptidase/acylaminoacyl peptidase
VEQFGPVNFHTLWEKTPPQNRLYMRDLVGDPQENPELYDRMSPLTYLHQVRAPLLVLQGENDPRVPASEAHQVVDFLQQHGKVVSSHFYPGEGHGYAKRENQIDALQRSLAWFDHYLKGEGDGTPSEDSAK